MFKSKLNLLNNEEICFISDLQSGAKSIEFIYCTENREKHEELVKSIEQKIGKNIKEYFKIEKYQNNCDVLEQAIFQENINYIMKSKDNFIKQSKIAISTSKTDEICIINPLEEIKFSLKPFYRVLAFCRELKKSILKDLKNLGILIYTTGNQVGDQEYLLYFKRKMIFSYSCPINPKQIYDNINTIYSRSLNHDNEYSDEDKENMREILNYLEDCFPSDVYDDDYEDDLDDYDDYEDMEIDDWDEEEIKEAEKTPESIMKEVKDFNESEHKS